MCGCEREQEKKNSVCVCVSLRGHFSHSTGRTDGDLHQLSLTRTAELLKDLHRHKEERAYEGTMTLENGLKVTAL